MKLNTREKNAFEILKRLLKEAKVSVTDTSLKKEILTHGESTTILGLSDLLNDFSVPNMTVRLNISQLEEIPVPAVAYLEIGTFVTLLEVKNGQVRWFNDTFGMQEEPIEIFVTRWQGVTLLIEPNEKSGEQNYTKNRKREVFENIKWPAGILILVGLFFFYVQSSSYLYYALLGTKALGFMLSILLTAYSLGSDSSFLNKVCKINRKTDCGNLLSKKEAYLFGLISWAEIGLFYFAGGLLSLFILPNSLTFLYLLAISAPVYIIWSLYYQAFVAKQWCPLCLGVLMVLLTEFILFIQSDIFFSIALKDILIFALPVVLWFLIKPYVIKSSHRDSLYYGFQRLKFDEGYIGSWYNFQNYLPPIFGIIQTIKLGDANAKNQIIAVINPTCSACESHYNALRKLEETAHIHIIMAVSLDLEDEAGKVARAVMAKTTNEERIRALDLWFNKKIYNRIPDTEKETTVLLSEHIRWLNLANITEAPKIFLDQNLMPGVYHGAELQKLVKTVSTLGFANQQ